MNFFCFWLSVGVLSSVIVVSQQKTIPITPNEVVRDKCLELCSVEDSQGFFNGPCGLMEKASDFESEDCRFESCHGRKVIFFVGTEREAAENSKRNHYLFQQCLIDCNNNIPGPPMIKDIDGVVYKIFWEPANSSRIQIYSLEGLYSKTSDIFAELIELEEEQEKEALENPGAANEQFVEEPYVKSDNWKVVCNTTETYCKMEDLYQQNILSFRVRAMNLKGWGPYVYSRQPIEEPTDRGHLIIATFLPAILVCTSVFFCFIYVCISKLHKRRVRHKRDTLPHWAQFHQVEYAFPRILTDSEIGILPEFQDTNLKNLKYLGRGFSVLFKFSKESF
uniref:Fibronectin type-III domain-containing protein n=1 Tax=Megaselia scalaris TaxID=36166 RepID=T1GCG1_MEGSC